MNIAANHPDWWTCRRVPSVPVKITGTAISNQSATRLLMGGIVRHGRYIDLVRGRASAHTNVGAGASPAGPAGLFNGTTSGIVFPDEPGWDVSAITALVGFTPRATGVAGPLVARWDDIGVNKRVWSLNVSAADAVRFDASTNGTFNTNFRATGPTVVAGRRYVAAGRSGSSATSTIIVDGSSSNSSASTVSSLFATDIGVEIGTSEFGGGSRVYFSGLIDFVFVWSGLMNTAMMQRLTANPSLLVEPAYDPFPWRVATGNRRRRVIIGACQ